MWRFMCRMMEDIGEYPTEGLLKENEWHYRKGGLLLNPRPARKRRARRDPILEMLKVAGLATPSK
jgi:hypothetical protein